MTHRHPPSPLDGRRAWMVLVCALLALQSTMYAWIYPEHREIMARAIRDLDTRRHGQLMQLWNAARRGHESRLSAAAADTPAIAPPQTLDLASWPAIAGDHSTSAADMTHTILETDWILRVAGVTHRLNAALSWAGLERHARTNALRDADLQLLRTDPGYAAHAGANNAHFLLARSEAIPPVRQYIDTCLRAGREILLSRVLVPGDAQILGFLAGEDVQIPVGIQVEELDEIELGAIRAAYVVGAPHAFAGRAVE